MHCNVQAIVNLQHDKTMQLIFMLRGLNGEKNRETLPASSALAIKQRAYFSFFLSMKHVSIAVWLTFVSQKLGTSCCITKVAPLANENDSSFYCDIKIFFILSCLFGMFYNRSLHDSCFKANEFYLCRQSLKFRHSSGGGSLQEAQSRGPAFKSEETSGIFN